MFDEILANVVAQSEWVLLVLITIIIAGPLISERLRLPGMLGLVVGGILLGPYVLGFLPEGSLTALGGLGIIYLMFMAGAELDLNLFKKYQAAAITFSLLTFAGPFILALGVSRYFLGFSWMAAVLMGAVWASHTLVAYSIIQEEGLTNNKSIAVVVGSTAITDTLALLILALVSGLTDTGGDAGSSNGLFIVIIIVLKVALLLAYSMFFLPWFARRFFAGPGQERLLRFVFILGGFVSAAFLAEFLGIEGIVGAFFAGIGLNRLIPNDGRLMERIEFFGTALFIPAFLVSVGMLINPAVLFSLDTIRMALLFGAALVMGKLLAAVIAGKRFKFSWAEIGAMFSLTLGQAAATLASTLVGLKIGLFGEDVVNSVLLVVLISLIATSLGTRFFSKKIETEDLEVKPIGKSIMVPVRPSPMLKRTMTLAAEIAQADAGTVTPVVVVPEHDVASKRQEAEEWLKKSEQYGAAATADVEGVLRIDTSIPVGVYRELQERYSSLILVEWYQDPGLGGLLFGNEIDRIGARSTVPVAAVRFTKDEIKRLVLVTGTDNGSTGYRTDLQIAVDIASRLFQSTRLPLYAFSPNEDDLSTMGLPDDVDLVSVESGIDAVVPLLQAGDLVLIPGAVVRSLLGYYTSVLSSVADQVSVVIAAGPHRLRLTSSGMGHETNSIMSFQT